MVAQELKSLPPLLQVVEAFTDEMYEKRTTQAWQTFESEMTPQLEVLWILKLNGQFVWENRPGASWLDLTYMLVQHCSFEEMKFIRQGKLETLQHSNWRGTSVKNAD